MKLNLPIITASFFTATLLAGNSSNALPSANITALLTSYHTTGQVTDFATIFAGQNSAGEQDCTTTSPNGLLGLLGNSSLLNNITNIQKLYCKVTTENKASLDIIKRLNAGEINMQQAATEYSRFQLSSGSIAEAAAVRTSEAAQKVLAENGLDAEVITEEIMSKARQVAKVSAATQTATLLGNVKTAVETINQETSNTNAITSTLEAMQALLKVQASTGEILAAKTIVDAQNVPLADRQIALAEQQHRLARAEATNRTIAYNNYTDKALSQKAMIAGAFTKTSATPIVSRPPIITANQNPAIGTSGAMPIALQNLKTNN